MNRKIRLILIFNILFSILFIYSCFANNEIENNNVIYAANEVELERALSTVQTGQIIELTGDCYIGSFHVPPHAKIKGNNATMLGGTIGDNPRTPKPQDCLRNLGGTVGGNPPRTFPCVLCMETRENNSVFIDDLIIRNDGIAVLVLGNGTLNLNNVDIEVGVGAGMLVESNNLNISNSNFRGPLPDPDEEPDRYQEILLNTGTSLNPRQTAIAGLVMFNISSTRLRNVNIRGFVGMSLIQSGGFGDWDEVWVDNYVGTGVLAEQSVVNAQRLHVSRGARGLRSYTIVTNALTISMDAKFMSVNSILENIDGIGLLQDQSTSNHVGLTIRENKFAGVWAQNSQNSEEIFSFVIDEGTVENNSGISTYFNNVQGVQIKNTEIIGTRLRPQTMGLDIIDIGDGIQFSNPLGLVNLENVILSDNARIGFLLDGGDRQNDVSPDDFIFENIQISSQISDSYGFLQQNLEGIDAQELLIDDELMQRDLMAREEGIVLDLTPSLNAFSSIRSNFSNLQGEDGFVSDGMLRDGLIINGNGVLDSE